MKIYNEFAGIYDKAMDNIPYETWFHDLYDFLVARGTRGGTICDLGCGTGIMTEYFAKAGYDMIGVDLSEEMLNQAMEKKLEHDIKNIIYVHQDMKELDLPTKVDAMISVCDSMNYLVDEQDMAETLQGVAEFLKPGGVFICDMKTEYCYKSVMGNQVWTEQMEEATYIWENYYYEEEKLNEYMMTIFRKQPDSEWYSKSEESHYQRAYTVEQMKKLLTANDLELISVFGERIGESVKEDSDRMYLVIAKQK